MARARETGARAEQLAADFLRARGFRILQRNVRTPYGEIDIVGQEAGMLVLVEVRYRASALFGHPEATVLGKKFARMRASAEWYVAHVNWAHHYRIDVVGITGGPPEMTHIRNASE